MWVQQLSHTSEKSQETPQLQPGIDMHNNWLNSQLHLYFVRYLDELDTPLLLWQLYHYLIHLFARVWPWCPKMDNRQPVHKTHCIIKIYLSKEYCYMQITLWQAFTPTVVKYCLEYNTADTIIPSPPSTRYSNTSIYPSDIIKVVIRRFGIAQFFPVLHPPSLKSPAWLLHYPLF